MELKTTHLSLKPNPRDPSHATLLDYPKAGVILIDLLGSSYEQIELAHEKDKTADQSKFMTASETFPTDKTQNCLPKTGHSTKELYPNHLAKDLLH